VLTPSVAEGDRHGWQAYVIQLDNRDEALRTLRGEGIEVQIGTYALHHLGAYRDRGAFPVPTALRRALALPFATTMTEDECDRVAPLSPASSARTRPFHTQLGTLRHEVDTKGVSAGHPGLDKSRF
jgi:hypothetical protein